MSSFLASVFAGWLACWLFGRRQAASSYRSLKVLLAATSYLANAFGLLDAANALGDFYAGMGFLSRTKNRETEFSRLVGTRRS